MDSAKHHPDSTHGTYGSFCHTPAIVSCHPSPPKSPSSAAALLTSLQGLSLSCSHQGGQQPWLGQVHACRSCSRAQSVCPQWRVGILFTACCLVTVRRGGTEGSPHAEQMSGASSSAEARPGLGIKQSLLPWLTGRPGELSFEIALFMCMKANAFRLSQSSFHLTHELLL